MENQTTEQPAQSEQSTDVVQNTEATAAVNETVLTTDQPQTNFKDTIPEQYREEKSLENINSMDDLLKGYVHAQKLVGTNKIPVPNKHSTDEDWNEVFKRLGAPDTPEGYQYNLKDVEMDQSQVSIRITS